MRGWGKVLSFEFEDGKKKIEFEDFARCSVLRLGDVQALCSRVGRSHSGIRRDAEFDITHYQLLITNYLLPIFRFGLKLRYFV